MPLTTQEAEALVAALGKQTSYVTAELKEFGDNVSDHNEAQRDALDEFDENLKRKTLHNTKENTAAAARAREMKKQESGWLKRTQFEQLQLQKDKARFQRLSELKSSMEKQEGVTQERLDRMTKALGMASAKIASTSMRLDKANTQTSLYTAGINEQTAKLGKIDWGVPFKNMKEKIKSGVGQMFSAALLVKGGTEVYDSMKTEIATGISLAWTDYFSTKPRFGLDAKEYAELITANRQAVLASGGLVHNFNLLQEGQSQYFDRIGDLGATTKYTQEQMSIFARSGIKPTMADVSLLGASFTKLQKLAGLTSVQMNALVSDVVEDESTITLLRATTSENERRAIVEGTTRRIAENVALGMTTEQAKAAAKALNKLAGKGPLERFKDAAKMQAMGAALGVSGGGEAAAIHRKGARATQAEKDQLQDYLSQISNAIGTSKTGSQGFEFMVDSMAEKLNIKPMLEPLNTTLAQSVAATDAAQKSLGDIGENTKRSMNWLQHIYGALTSSGAKVVGGAVGGAVDLMSGVGGNILSGLAGAGLKGLFGAGAGAATAGTATAATAATAGAGAAGLTAAAVAGSVAVLAATGAASYGLTRLVDKGIEKISGQGMSERVSRWFESDAEKAANAMMAQSISPSKTTTAATSPVQQTADGITKQVDKMNETNTFLKQLTETADKQLDVAEKQLAAALLTEKQKTSGEFRSGLQASGGLTYASTP